MSVPANHTHAITAFKLWINQDPGLDPRDYGIDTTLPASKHDQIAKKAFEDEKYNIKRQGKRAKEALNEFATLEYDPVVLESVMKSSFSGRLQFDDNEELEYCVGQYYPTEYRLAAAVVLEDYNNRMRPRITEPAVRTMHQLKQRNAHNGYSFFREDTMAYFNSEVETPLMQGGYFVTSERYDEDGEKQYTLRMADLNTGEIHTIGEFGAYRAIKEAKDARIKHIQEMRKGE